MSAPVLIAVLALAAVGLVAIIAFLLYLFTAIGKNADRLYACGAVPSVRTRAFLDTVTSVSGACPCYVDCTEVRTITDGRAFREQLIEDIDASKITVHLTAYVWSADPSVERLFDALTNAVARGVTVRLLIDAFGAMSFPAERIETLRAAGVMVSQFRPLRFGKVSRYHARTHRRAFVIDGVVAYTGGMAIADEWFAPRSSPRHRYTDVMYRFVGPPVTFIESSFAELWASTENEVIIEPREGGGRRQAQTQAANGFHLAHAPRVDVHPLTYALWTACAAARESIVLASPYFVPGRSLASVIRQRAAAGVVVHLILQGRTEHSIAQLASKSYYGELLASGVAIWEYQPHILHSKLLVVDETLTVLGSANYDIRSQRINHENVLGIVDEAFARKQRALLASYQQVSKQVTQEAVAQRSYFKALGYRMVRGFSEQF